MTPELLNLYQELVKFEAYLNRKPNDPRLHLVVIDQPMTARIYEFGVPEV
jgi:hypothetical protein